MSFFRSILIVACVIALATSVSGTTYYVATNGAHTAPYDNWTNAASDIQTVVDYVTAGSEIIVSNGTYDSGGRAIAAGMTNRVVIDKAVTVRSLNGPEVTFIVGQPCPTNGGNGHGAIRCVYMANSATIDGFTITNGYTVSHETTAALHSGGGVYASTSDSVISNCIITGNAAYMNGGGVSGAIIHRSQLIGNQAGTLGGGGGADECIIYNSIIRNNLAYGGGGANYSKLYNCTIVDNVGTNRGGGIAYSTCINSIMYYNTSGYGNNFYYWRYTNCCMTPNSSSGTGTVTNEPLFVDRANGDFRLQSNSPCINAGVYQGWASGSTDFEGDPRVVGLAVDIGAYEYQSLSDQLSVEIYAPYQQAVLGIALPFEARITGNEEGYTWDFGDGQWAQDEQYTTNLYAGTGFYDVVLTASNLAGSFSTTVQVEIVSAGFSYYVATNGSDSDAGTNWATAKQTIQAAVDAAGLGCNIWVTNGVYDQGGRVADAGLTNRVAIDKELYVYSMNGPDYTCVVGQPHATNEPNGDAAIRCVYLNGDARLDGFTISNGHTRVDGDNYKDESGGGIYCPSTNAVITNCVLVMNTANRYGGGAYRGSLYNCEVTDNTATYYGGGLYGSAILFGRIANNTARSGGGIASVLAVNSVIYDNIATQYGGGAYASSCKIYSCAVVGNSAGEKGGGSFRTVARNSIFYYNSAPVNDEFFEGSFTNSCTYPLPAVGTDNITNAPGIVSVLNPRLLPGSTCIDKGTNEWWMPFAPDLDGYPRITGGIVDIGAYEFYSDSVLTGALTVAISATYTQAPTGFSLPFEAVIAGRAQGYAWDFDDGSGETNLCNVSHTYSGAGYYDVTLIASNLSGSVAATVRVAVVALDCNYYVDPNGSDAADGTNWATAKQTIQAAVDEASLGCTIWVSNGVYNTGGSVVHAGLTNRVTIDEIVTVRSMNGPTNTFIVGQPCPTNGWTGDGAIRCVYLADGAQLIGFTLTNGYTLSSGGDSEDAGGVFCGGSGATISNCVVTGCGAEEDGGGVRGGSVYQSSFINNRAGSGGGASDASLTDCGLTNNVAKSGGGTHGCTLLRCELNANAATNTHGGGAYGGTLTECVVYTNTAKDKGGGIYNAQAVDCVLQGNTSTDGGGAYGGSLDDCSLIDNEVTGAIGVGGGASQADLVDCDLLSNTAVYGGGTYDGTLTNCTLTGNIAIYGGGAYDGTIYNCSLNANVASNGGGMFNGTAYSSAFSNNAAHSGSGKGGGACQTTLHGSWLSHNTARDGGGAQLCTLYNCVLLVNTAYQGGGASSSAGDNNTIVYNKASSFGGGTFWGTFNNTIVYYNDGHFSSPNWYLGYFTNSCSSPSPDGTDNIGSAPSFVDAANANYRLFYGSPCIDDGTNQAWMIGATDFDGNTRVFESIVDMGAYEYNASLYDSDTDGLSDSNEVYETGTSPTNVNTDGDFASDYDEWIADTDGADSNDYFVVVAASNTASCSVYFKSSSNRYYSMEYSDDMRDGSWAVLDGQSNVPGAGGPFSMTDTNDAEHRAYRVRVSLP